MTRQPPTAADPAATPEHEPPSEDALWTGDTGTLSFPSRRALARLLTGPLVQSRRQPEIWAAVVSDEVALRSRLADVFLDLVLDHDAGIAFTRQVDTGGRVEVPAVLRTETLSHMDTVLLLHLRADLAVAQPGERVIVDKGEVQEQVDVYRPVIDSDQVRFTRKFDASWNRLKSYSLLTDTETEGRAEVSPVLRHLFDANVVSGIRDEYRALLDAPDGQVFPDDPDDDDADDADGADDTAADATSPAEDDHDH